MTKEQAAELRRLYAELVAQPAEVIRQRAVSQRDAIETKIAKAKGILGALLPRWTPYARQLADIAQTLQRGDDLASLTDEESRKQRRKYYGTAWLRYRQLAQDVDAEVAEGGNAVTTWTTVTDAAADSTGAAVDKALQVAKETASSVGQTAQTAIYLLAGGAALGLVMYAQQRGKRGRQYG